MFSSRTVSLLFTRSVARRMGTVYGRGKVINEVHSAPHLQISSAPSNNHGRV
jgi:hypothetical protein